MQLSKLLFKLSVSKGAPSKQLALQQPCSRLQMKTFGCSRSLWRSRKQKALCLRRQGVLQSWCSRKRCYRGCRGNQRMQTQQLWLCINWQGVQLGTRRWEGWCFPPAPRSDFAVAVFPFSCSHISCFHLFQMQPSVSPLGVQAHTELSPCLLPV